MMTVQIEDLISANLWPSVCKTYSGVCLGYSITIIWNSFAGIIYVAFYVIGMYLFDGNLLEMFHLLRCELPGISMRGFLEMLSCKSKRNSRVCINQYFHF